MPQASPQAWMRRAARWTLDLTIIAASWLLAFGVRFEFMPTPDRVDQIIVTLPYILLLKLLALSAQWVHRTSWQYIGIRDVVAVIRATAGVALVLTAVRVTAGAFTRAGGPWADAVIPFGVIAADLAFSTIGLLGIRFLRRLTSESQELRSRPRAEVMSRTLVIGAGRAGAMIAQEIRQRPDLGRFLVGFVDDDPLKTGRRIHGVDVLGGLPDLPRIVEDHHVDDVIIAIASANGADIRRINQEVEDAGLSAQIVPGLYEIVDGQVSLSRLRPVSIEDLLRRDTVELDISGIQALIGHDVVMVTGAGGSIGSELCRQLARFNPRTMVLVERAETPLWAIERELSAAFPAVTYVQALCDVQSEAQIQQLMLEHRPTTVFHAAAHKHVPMCEANPDEAVRNNVLGTRTVVDAAVAAGVPRFVLVSTDKAVNPTSVMGATKRLAEQYVCKVAAATQLAYVSVRFGNVLGSNGSVVPIFKQQIEDGGPVTVTDADMTRYFMTIPEASQLVVQAATLGTPGDLFVLEMGEPVRIMDLAQDLIRLSGLEPGVDIEILTTGIRPGEKLYEELAYDHEDLEPTTNPKIMRRPDTAAEALALNGPLARMSDPALRSELLRVFDVGASPHV